MKNSDSYIINGVKYVREEERRIYFDEHGSYYIGTDTWNKAEEKNPEPKKSSDFSIPADSLPLPENLGWVDSKRFTPEGIHLREVSPDEICITKEQLAEAWRNAELNSNGPHFTNFCNTLGFKE